MIKEECIHQSLQFINWDKNQKYSNFHSSHYDWWAFPVDKPSSYGEKYQITSEERSKLLLDQAFLNALRTNAILVCRSWGYDLENGKNLTTLTKEQRWQRWPIRLYKMSCSLELFQQRDLHMNSIKYGMSLIKKGEKFMYMGRHLDEYFRKWENSAGL